MPKKLEILNSLIKSGEELSEEEKEFLKKNSDKSIRNFARAKTELRKDAILSLKECY